MFKILLDAELNSCADGEPGSMFSCWAADVGVVFPYPLMLPLAELPLVDVPVPAYDPPLLECGVDADEQ